MQRYQCSTCTYAADRTDDTHTRVTGHTVRDTARVCPECYAIVAVDGHCPNAGMPEGDGYGRIHSDDRPEWVKRANSGTLPVKVYR